MAKLKMIFVSPSDDGWKIKKPENDRASAILDTKAEAVKKATEIAKEEKRELVIQRQDGTIQEKNSFGNDPNPPKG